MIRVEVGDGRALSFSISSSSAVRFRSTGILSFIGLGATAVAFTSRPKAMTRTLSTRS